MSFHEFGKDLCPSAEMAVAKLTLNARSFCRREVIKKSRTTILIGRASSGVFDEACYYSEPSAG
jgi:hypothetical protein